MKTILTTWSALLLIWSGTAAAFSALPGESSSIGRFAATATGRSRVIVTFESESGGRVEIAIFDRNGKLVATRAEEADRRSTITVPLDEVATDLAGARATLQVERGTVSARAEIERPAGVIAVSDLIAPADAGPSCFTPQPTTIKHRAAHPAPACTDNPTLAITTSKDAAQFGEEVQVTWTASEPSAHVCIDGIGSGLPANGTVLVPIFGRVNFHGRASTCNFGPGVTASVSLCQPSSGAIHAASASVPLGTTTNVTIEASAPWTLSSENGNGLSRSSGFGPDTVVFTGRVVGLDSLVLVITSDCDNITRNTSVAVPAANPEP